MNLTEAIDMVEQGANPLLTTPGLLETTPRPVMTAKNRKVLDIGESQELEEGLFMKIVIGIGIFKAVSILFSVFGDDLAAVPEAVVSSGYKLLDALGFSNPHDRLIKKLKASLKKINDVRQGWSRRLHKRELDKGLAHETIVQWQTFYGETRRAWTTVQQMSKEWQTLPLDSEKRREFYQAYNEMKNRVNYVEKLKNKLVAALKRQGRV